jgi:hypothetical protein
MKKLVLPGAVVVMLVVLAGAFALDCLRYAASARQRVALADDEMRKHEQRLVGLLTTGQGTTPELQAALAAHSEAAGSMRNRHAAYRKLAAVALGSTSNADPKDPLARKRMDDIAGAINRRDVAEKQYEVEAAAYQQFLGKFMGSVAKVFSSQARADGRPALSAEAPLQ